MARNYSFDLTDLGPVLLRLPVDDGPQWAERLPIPVFDLGL